MISAMCDGGKGGLEEKKWGQQEEETGNDGDDLSVPNELLIVVFLRQQRANR